MKKPVVRSPKQWEKIIKYAEKTSVKEAADKFGVKNVQGIYNQIWKSKKKKAVHVKNADSPRRKYKKSMKIEAVAPSVSSSQRLVVFVGDAAQISEALRNM